VQEQLGYIVRTNARDAQIRFAARIAHGLLLLRRRRLAEKEMVRENHRKLAYTTNEWKQRKECRTYSNCPAR